MDPFRARPEGPGFNSHAREGVEREREIIIEARRADTNQCRTFGARMLSRLAGSTASPAVAINLRPFGPHLRKALIVSVRVTQAPTEAKNIYAA